MNYRMPALTHMARLPELQARGWVPISPYCQHCGTDNIVRWVIGSGVDPLTGRRNGHWETYCPRRSRLRFWHHSGGRLMSPPPRSEAQAAAEDAA